MNLLGKDLRTSEIGFLYIKVRLISNNAMPTMDFQGISLILSAEKNGTKKFSDYT